MDRNSIIGIILIFLILMIWQWTAAPTAEQAEVQQRIQDSLDRVAMMRDSLATKADTAIGDTAMITPVSQAVADSVQMAAAQNRFGIFGTAAVGEKKSFILENEVMQITFSSKGGMIEKVWLKDYYKVEAVKGDKSEKVPLHLLDNAKNVFEFLLPVSGPSGASVSSQDLYFTARQSDNTITFRATAQNGGYFEQTYTLHPDSYLLDYSLNTRGLDQNLTQPVIRLNWVNYLDKIEKNSSYERNYSTVYYKPVEDDPDYCSCTSDDEEEVNKDLRWVANTQQFFNSTLIAKDKPFRGAQMETKVLGKEDSDLKKLTTRLDIPLGVENQQFAMNFYIGPNKFDDLKAIGYDLQDIVPFGWSIFGTINRWVIRPLFGFLSSYVGSAGLVILLLTLIVKGALFPLTYKMIHSQSKMAVLKPELAKLKEKYKDDQQQIQVESMKMYREFGVNPLGGCMPVLLQMPIWFALYRFFPASIEFRQESFLWADDLSSYDVFMSLPFDIPFYGAHVSLFTLIWVATTIIYSYYNSQFMDYSANPMMKYMQYAMPVMFIFFFNNFASGLTAYLCFSNILNIGQTVVTKNYLIDTDKIREKMELNKKKPKKKGGFQQRLEAALKEQQRMQQDKQKKKKK